MKPDCYKCKHRRDVPGDAHIECAHPSRMDKSVMRVEGAAHGVRNGWFMWPHNFDPVWLRNCDGFTALDVIAAPKGT